MGDEFTTAELTRELHRLAIAIDGLATRMDEQFREMRADLVRKDVYDTRIKGVEAQIEQVERAAKEREAELAQDVADLKSSRRAIVTAVGSILLTIVAGVVVFLLQRGLTA